MHTFLSNFLQLNFLSLFLFINHKFHTFSPFYSFLLPTLWFEEGVHFAFFDTIVLFSLIIVWQSGRHHRLLIRVNCE
jgi:hypothetical protein